MSRNVKVGDFDFLCLAADCHREVEEQRVAFLVRKHTRIDLLAVDGYIAERRRPVRLTVIHPAEVVGIGGFELYFDFSLDAGIVIRDDLVVVSSGSGDLEPRSEELCAVTLGFHLEFRERLSGDKGLIVCDFDITFKCFLFLDGDGIRIGRTVTAVEITVYSAVIIPPVVVHLQLSGFYILHGIVGVYDRAFCDGFSVDQHHRGVAESVGVGRRIVVIRCSDPRKRVLYAEIPGNRIVGLFVIRRRYDAESACDDRSYYGDDEQSYDFACVLFHFAFLPCNNGFCSLNIQETYPSSYDTIIMHILALVTVKSVSCFG